MLRTARVKPGCLLGIIVALLCLMWMSNQGQRRMRERQTSPPAGQTTPGAPPVERTPGAPPPAQGPERAP